MVERHVVFETIKIGEVNFISWEHYRAARDKSAIEKGRIEFETGMEPWYSVYELDFLIPIADVYPFHIVGGHITTNLERVGCYLIMYRIGRHSLGAYDSKLFETTIFYI